ncbi:UNVERIFIED_CONTAM: hypothetical protein NCL1_62819 [Trichonephila clavipes]
MYLLQIELF